MAKIIRTNDQETALKTINESLKILVQLDEILSLTEPEDVKTKIAGFVKLDGQNPDAQEKKTVSLSLPYLYFIPVIKEYKRTLVNSITSKSKEFHIELEEEEKKLLS